MKYDYSFQGQQSLPIEQHRIAELIRISDTCSEMKKYQLLEALRQIVSGLRRGSVTIEVNDLVPRMLAVGRTRGTPEFEKAVTNLLALLAKKIPSSEYSQEFEAFI